MTIYTKNKLIETIINQESRFADIANEFTEASLKMSGAITSMENAIKDINDRNVYHLKESKKAISGCANITAQNQKTIEGLIESNKAFYKGLFKAMGYAFVLIILALIILAGAEKTLKFIPQIPRL